MALLVPTFGGDLLDRFFNALEKAQEALKDLVHLLEKKSLKKTAALLQKPKGDG